MSKIFLREINENDINQDYLNGFDDNSVTEFLEVEGKSLTKEAVLKYIARGIETKSYYLYAICLKSNNKHIGNVKIGPINKKHSTSDLVTVIWDSQQWGKGLATEAIKEGNRLAFNEYNIRKLSGGIYEKNIGSIKAYVKAGWIIEGKLQNHYLIDGKLQDRIVVSCFNPYFRVD